MVDVCEVGHIGRVVQVDLFAVAHIDVIDHGGRGGDEFDVIFPLNPVADHFEVQKPQEPAAEAKAKCC